MIRLDSELSEEIEDSVGVRLGLVLSFFAVVVDAVTEFAREGALSELVYADNLVLMSETIEGLRNKFAKLNATFESKGFKVNLGKTMAMVNGGILSLYNTGN